jgi:DNA-binding response OmpR family regulator
MTKKIAVVDDEADICHMLKLTLESRNFRVVTAGDGKAGKELVEMENPDLLICDIKMPRMNGYELISELQQSHRYSRLPIIVLTSLTEGSAKPDEDWRESLNVAGFISKPFEPKDVIACVERIFETCPQD